MGVVAVQLACCRHAAAAWAVSRRHSGRVSVPVLYSGRSAGRVCMPDRFKLSLRQVKAMNPILEAIR